MTGESGQLVEAWIKRYEIINNSGKESPEAKALLWASEELDDLCRGNPQFAIRMILNILASTQGEYALAMLSAGPLEIVLAYHGKEIISEVELFAKNDPRFRTLLRGVWQNQMDDHTWGRVLKARIDPAP